MLNGFLSKKNDSKKIVRILKKKLQIKKLISSIFALLLLLTGTISVSAETNLAEENVKHNEAIEQGNKDDVQDDTSFFVDGDDSDLSEVIDDSQDADTVVPQSTKIIKWEFNDTEEYLVEYEGDYYLALMNLENHNFEEILKDILPNEILVTYEDERTETLSISSWNLDILDEAEADEYYNLQASFEQDLELDENVRQPHVIFTFSDVELYDETVGDRIYPGNRQLFASKDELEKAIKQHTVQGVTPDGVTINLFDYVGGVDGAKSNDISEKENSRSKPNHWNKGINKDRLLIFGDSTTGAGYWNIGAGAGREWARQYTNMKNIVEKTLKDGYPVVNENEVNTLVIGVGVAGVDTGKPFLALLQWANDASKETDYRQAKALSDYIIDNAVRDEEGNIDYSLDYLFDPTIKLGDDVKRIYENVTGLFQIDDEGYYYYDARKNFVEFTPNEGSTKDGRGSDGSFTLYDGPAIWRTDGGWEADKNAFGKIQSMGNFFPFNKATQVFDSYQVNDDGSKVLSSSPSINITDVAKGTAVNKATNEKIFLNHHIGMTMEVNFMQPEGGRLNMGQHGKQDMVFQFSGDDDVWLFIDDVLVLDLGGIHSELYGSINFANGDVYIGQSWRTGGIPDNIGGNPGHTKTNLYTLFQEALSAEEFNELGWANGNTPGSKIFPTGTTHNLKLFYLERGNYDSSLQLRFNMQPTLYHEIKKVDQNGDALAGVEFDLYLASPNAGIVEGSVESTNVDNYHIVGDKLGHLVTGDDGRTTFSATNPDGEEYPFSFTDQYHLDGTLYYILKEVKTVDGYRELPKDIVIKFDPDTSMLVVQNRYQTGAYASFYSVIREAGQLTYGVFDEVTGNIIASATILDKKHKSDGLIVAVPMLYEKNMIHNGSDTPIKPAPGLGKWVALYGSNTDGYGATEPESRTAPAWREAVLKGVLYQCTNDKWPRWFIEYDETSMKLDGTLSDLPGQAKRYAIKNHVNPDMKMVYGIIEPYALKELGINETTSEGRYKALEQYLKREIVKKMKNGLSEEVATQEAVGETFEKIYNAQDPEGTSEFSKRGFSFLDTNEFQREFRSIIYVPNERRELRVWKVDEDGRGINGAEFTLYKATKDGDEIVLGEVVGKGVTATMDGRDGTLILTPDVETDGHGHALNGYAEVHLVEDKNFIYALRETKAPSGHVINPTIIPVIIGNYSVYADAGTVDDGVSVMSGVGKLIQTMTKFAANDIVNITLRDITAIPQVQEDLASFSLDGWHDDILAGTTKNRSMNLHYGVNALINYGLHDEDGGKTIYPFFITDTGFIRTRVEQNTDALMVNHGAYNTGSNNLANWDDLRGQDITSLFSQINIVVVTDRKTTKSNTGRLRVSKTVSASGQDNSIYDLNFQFDVSLKDAKGNPLKGEYYYYGQQKSGYIRDGGMLSLRHDEALTILGLPTGTKWTITEHEKTGWTCFPESGVLSGEIKFDTTEFAPFVNYIGDDAERLGHLSVTKTVSGGGDIHQKFNFIVTLSDTTINGYYGGMRFKDGVAKVVLAHNESAIATGLPEGITYTVEEIEANEEGYTTTSVNETGTVIKDTTVDVAFDNYKPGNKKDKHEKVVNTGVR